MAAPVPVIQSMSISGHWLSGNVFVQLQGGGFTGATSVTFGNVPAQWFFVVSDAQINCVPAPVLSPQTVNVTVTTPGGVSLPSLGNQFIFASSQVNTGIQIPRTQVGSRGYFKIYLADKTNKTWPSTYYGHTWIIDDEGGAPDVDVVVRAGNVKLSGTVLGPGGNAWFVGFDTVGGLRTPFVWKVTPAGIVSQYQLSLAGTTYTQAGVTDLCTANGGVMWAVGYGFGGPTSSEVIWQIKDDGTSTIFSLTSLPVSTAGVICVGPDPNSLWIFTEATASLVVNANVVSTFPIVVGTRFSACLGSDRNVWVAGEENGISGVSQVNVVTGVATPAVLSPSGILCGQIHPGPDGNMYAPDQSGLLYAINPNTLAVTTTPLPSTAAAIAAGGGPTGVCTRRSGQLSMAVFTVNTGGVDSFIIDVGQVRAPPYVPPASIPVDTCHKTNPGKRGFSWAPQSDCPAPSV